KLRKLEAQEINAEIKTIDEQLLKSLQRAAKEGEPESVDRQAVEAVLPYMDAWKLLSKAVAAQGRLELQIAASYLEEASLMVKQASARFTAASEAGETVRLMKGMTSGLESLVEAQKIYASVLQKALTGGATAQSLVDLERAEQLFLTT